MPELCPLFIKLLASTVHLTKKLKHIFPGKKLCGLILKVYIYVSGSGLYIPMVDLIWNLYFPVLLERSSGWRQFPALPSAPAVEPRVHINVQHTNFQFGKITDYEWKQLILVVNFLFGWRVNKIPNRHFYCILPGPSFAM
jgi:hypothetical protein